MITLWVNFGRDTGYWGLRVFLVYLSPTRQILEYYLKLGLGRFSPRPLQFNFSLSSKHSKLYDLTCCFAKWTTHIHIHDDGLSTLLFLNKCDILFLWIGGEGAHISAVVPPMRPIACCVSWLRRGIWTGAIRKFGIRSYIFQQEKSEHTLFVTKWSSCLKGKLFNVENIFIVRLINLRRTRCVRPVEHIANMINAYKIY
jgi:hypothetical protein